LRSSFDELQPMMVSRVYFLIALVCSLMLVHGTMNVSMAMEMNKRERKSSGEREDEVVSSLLVPVNGITSHTFHFTAAHPVPGTGGNGGMSFAKMTQSFLGIEQELVPRTTRHTRH
jgi:hypothetical protein